MPINKLKVFQESFFPVSLILLTLFLVLLFVQYRVVTESDQTTVIHIPETVETQGEVTSTDAELLDDGVSVLSEAPSDSGAPSESGTKGATTARVDASAAEQELRAAVSQKRTSANLNNLGVFLFKQGRMEEALKTLNEAVNTKPQFDHALFNRAIVLSKLSRYQEALADYAALIKQNPAHYEGNYNSGVILLNQERNEEALEYFRRAAELAGGKRKSAALLRMALTLIRLSPKNKKEAVRALEQAIRLQPDNISARYWLARQEPDTAEGHARAMGQFETILSLSPNDGPTLIQISQIQAADGLPAEAEQTLAKALRTNPNSRTVRFHAGQLMMDRNRFAEAVLHFEWLVQKFPSDYIAYFNLARASYRSKHYEKAIEFYQKALSLRDGKYPEAYLNMGNVYKATKKYPEALQAYKSALRQKPEYPEAWFNLGLLYLRDNQMQEAEIAFKKATHMRKDYEEAWYNLGLIYSRTNQDEASIKAYQQALVIRPDYHKAQMNLAVMWARVNDFSKAIPLYQEVLAADPTNTQGWYNLGLSYMELSQNEEASNALRNVLKLEPENTKARRNLAKVALLRNQPGEAVSLLEAAVEIEPDNAQLRAELSSALRADNKIKAAVVELEKALRLKPNNTVFQRDLDELKKKL